MPSGAIDASMPSYAIAWRSDNPDASASGGTDWRWALFAVDDMQIGEHWTVTPALRYETQTIGGDDYQTDHNEALMGGVTARYAFGNGWAISGSASYNESLPILDDLGTPAYMTRSEKSETYEIGASYEGLDVITGGDRLALKLNVYDTTVWDVTSYSGVDSVKLQGAELEAAAALIGAVPQPGVELGRQVGHDGRDLVPLHAGLISHQRTSRSASPSRAGTVSSRSCRVSADGNASSGP